MSEKIITLSHVSAGYGRGGKDKTEYVLKDFSLDIYEGRCLCILGSNGSGKTTLLRTIAGILPSKGSISVCGHDMKTLNRKQIASYIAFLSQMSQVYFSYSVYETVMQGRYAAGQSGFMADRGQDREIVEETLKSLGLENIRNRQITELSGGQLQRVFLARAMAQRSPILLLDEPMNHLDLKVQAEFMEYLGAFGNGEISFRDGKSYKPTIVGVFHDITLAADIADDVAVLKGGELLFNGPKSEVLTKDSLLQAYDFDVAAHILERNKKSISFFL